MGLLSGLFSYPAEVGSRNLIHYYEESFRLEIERNPERDHFHIMTKIWEKEFSLAGLKRESMYSIQLNLLYGCIPSSTGIYLVGGNASYHMFLKFEETKTGQSWAFKASDLWDIYEQKDADTLNELFYLNHPKSFAALTAASENNSPPFVRKSMVLQRPFHCRQ